MSSLTATEKLGGIATPINAVQAFETKRCVRCHLIDVSWEAYGPDLARASLSGNFSDIVGRMWNKAPVMFNKMNELGIEYPTLHADDLIRVASFVGVYQNMLSNYTENADIEHGATLFHRSKCATCHNSKRMQGAFDSPLLVFAALWNHQRSMSAKGKLTQVTWRSLPADDINDLVGFLTDDELQKSGSQTSQFITPGDPDSGKQSFARLKCGSCHDDAGVIKNNADKSGISGNNKRLEIRNVFAAFWNHSPKIWRFANTSNRRPVVTAQTLANLAAYWYASRFENCNDDTTAGKTLFESKSCSSCHEIGSDDLAIPDTKDELLAQMWSHAPDMVKACSDKEIQWPKVKPGELSAIAEYLVDVSHQSSH